MQEREILGVQERTFPHSIMGELCNVKKKKEPVIIMICLAPSWKLRASEARMQEKEILGAQERIYPHSIMGELSNEEKTGSLPVITMICLAPSWKLRTSEAQMQERETLGAQERIFPHSIMGELSNVLERILDNSYLRCV